MMPRRAISFLLLAAVCPLGCNTPFIRSQSPEKSALTEPSDDPQLVGDVASPFGLHPVKVEAVGLVTRLPGTGSDPEPSPYRALLLEEMKSRKVAYPNQVLASEDTALVLVRATLRPGVQKGDHFDVEVRLPPGSDVKSLRGGWLMETRLTEVAAVGGALREGNLLALSKGPVMVDPRDDGGEGAASGHARVLGGGVCLKTRPLALILKPEHQHVQMAARIETAINRRFSTYRGGIKSGVATAKNDKYIELDVHSRYDDNVDRFVRVVRSLSLQESQAERLERQQLLEKQLLDPIAAADAALQLEAIGKDAAPALVGGLQAPDADVRFFAAEALAYLDQPEAIEPLADAARSEPAFRAYALAALGSMDEFKAYESLRDLLNVASSETRYGAFRALRSMNPHDALVRGEDLNKEFSLHVINTSGPELIHVTRSHRPEVVLFGGEQRFATPLVVEAGPHILIKGQPSGEIAVSRFDVDHPNRTEKRVVSSRVEDVVRAIAELGGSYPDAVQALQAAKSQDALATKLAVDALPQGGRRYRPGDGASSDELVEESSESEAMAGDGAVDDIPDNDSSVARVDVEAAESEGEDDAAGAENTGPIKGLFGKIGRRDPR